MDEQALPLALGVLGVVALAFLAVLVWSLIWVHGDAEKRGRSGCLVAILVFMVGWPLSLVLWLVARPDEPRR